MSETKSITSAQNPLYKQWLRLDKSSGISKENKLVIMGDKIIQDVLKNKKIKTIVEVIATKDHDLSIFKNYQGPIYELPNGLFQTLDSLNTQFPLVVVEPPQIPEWDPGIEPSEIEVLLPLQDPINLGAAIRSCVAFGAKKIILLRESAYPFLPRCIRSSVGTVLTAPLLLGPSIQELQKVKHLVTLDLGGTNITDFKWNQHVRLLVGEEGLGLPGYLKDHSNIGSAKIPISPNCESLNASASLAISLFSYRQKFRI